MKECEKTDCNCMGNCKECACEDKNKTKNNKAKIVSLAFVLFFILGINFCFGADLDSDKPGLLIISHGAPWPQWNQPVLNLEKAVTNELGSDNPFSKVKVVFMEFAKPSIADGVKEFEDAGCGRIVAVPLLIAPSSHSHWDIPALLGLYSDAKMEQQLKEEGAKIIRSKLPITLTATLADSGVIEEVMLKRVKELSNDPNNEAVVLLAHGDHMIGGLWEDFMKRTTIYVCGKMGISYGDWTCVEMGQGYDRAVAVISKAGESRKRIIVVGAYLSMGVDKMHARWTKQSNSMLESMPESMPSTVQNMLSEYENPLKDLDVVFGKRGLLPDSLIGKWIADVSKSEFAAGSTEK